MSTTKITVEDIHEIIVNAYNQAVTMGEDDISDINALDFTKLSDFGSDEDILKVREKFTGALIVQISKTFYKDRIGSTSLQDLYYEDAEKFGAITQFISATVPSLISNKAMQTFVSGTTEIGTTTVYLPIVESKLFIKTCSWAIPLSITGEQWNTAFKDESGLSTFVQYILATYENYTRLYNEMISRMNRNNFIAKKIESNNGVCNLIEEYFKTGRYTVGANQSKITWDDVKYDKDFLMWVKTEISHIKNLMVDFNDLYSTDTEPQSVPEDRIVCEFLDEFTLKIKEADSYVYHNDLITLPNYREVMKWQVGGTEEINQTIKMVMGEDENEDDIIVNSKIIGIMVDKNGIMHTNQLRRSPVEYFPREDITHYENQFVDKLICNLDNKAVIFTVDDYTIPEVGGEEDPSPNP